MATITTTSTTGTTTTTTSTHTTSETDGGKPIGIVLLIVASLGILLGIAAIIYSAVGINLALEGSGVEEMQAACRATFATASTDEYKSYNTGECGGSVDPEGADSGFPVEGSGGTQTWTNKMCGNSQEAVGCSYEDYKTGFASGTSTGMNCMIAAGLLAIIGSIPILLNGIFSFLNKENPARISGGCGVGLSVPSLIGMAVCAIILFVVSALTAFVAALSKGLTAYVAATSTGVCTPECSKSLVGTLTLTDHLTTYFATLTWLAVAMMILMLIESIVACVSCCTWKKKYEHHQQTTVVQMTAPVAAPVVAVAVVEEPPKM